MVLSPAAPPGRATVGWPHHWLQQEPLLERQHDRLEALLACLIEQHSQVLPVERLALTDRAEQLACRRLLWDLRLHLRLEERWLEAAGALCPGHRDGHREAAREALTQLCRGGASRRARLAWLHHLHSWFAAHRLGPDAVAYDLARQYRSRQSASTN
jgi:hemerythrin